MRTSASPRRSRSTSRSRCDPVEQPARALQRVRTPGRLLAAYQHVVGRLEEEQRGVPPGRALGESRLQVGEERAGADVDHDRDRALDAAALVDERGPRRAAAAAAGCR